jgi:CHC2 zinc finger
MLFERELLPDPASYFESEGLALEGHGRWQTTQCDFHGGSDSMRVNVDSGGWVCMACGERGGDVLAFHMKRHDLDFVAAAKALGAYRDDGRPHQAPAAPRPLSARMALDVLRLEAWVIVVAMRNVELEGGPPSDEDWDRVMTAVRRIEIIAEGAAA